MYTRRVGQVFGVKIPDNVSLASKAASPPKRGGAGQVESQFASFIGSKPAGGSYTPVNFTQSLNLAFANNLNDAVPTRMRSPRRRRWCWRRSGPCAST